MTAVVVLLAASALLLAITRPGSQAPRHVEHAASSLLKHAAAVHAPPSVGGAAPLTPGSRGPPGCSSPVTWATSTGTPWRARSRAPPPGSFIRWRTIRRASRPTRRRWCKARLAAQHASALGAGRGERRGQRRWPGRLPDRAAPRTPGLAGCSSQNWVARDVSAAKQGAVAMAPGRDSGAPASRLLAIFGVAVAVLGASFTGCEPSSEPALASTGPTPSAYALAEHPTRAAAALPAGRHAVRYRLVFLGVDR